MSMYHTKLGPLSFELPQVEATIDLLVALEETEDLSEATQDQVDRLKASLGLVSLDSVKDVPRPVYVLAVDVVGKKVVCPVCSSKTRVVSCAHLSGPGGEHEVALDCTHYVTGRGMALGHDSLTVGGSRIQCLGDSL